MDITKFLGKKKKLKKDYARKSDKEIMEMELAFGSPKKLQKIVPLTSKVKGKLIREVSMIFKSDILFSKFKKVAKLYRYPALSILVDDNIWLKNAIRKRYAKKVKEKK